MGKKNRQERAAAMENQAAVNQQPANEELVTGEASEAIEETGAEEVMDNKSEDAAGDQGSAGEEAVADPSGVPLEAGEAEASAESGEETKEVEEEVKAVEVREEQPAVTKVDTAVQDTVKVEKPADVDHRSENLIYLEDVRANGTPLQKQALAAIELFVERMKPRSPISEEKAVEAQRDFLDLITVILRKDFQEFRKAWAVLLVYFAEYHGDRPTAKDYSALSEYSTSRCLDAWNDNERSEAYNNFMTLLRVTRNIETRKQDVKRIRLDAIAPSLLSDRAKDNLQRFYA